MTDARASAVMVSAVIPAYNAARFLREAIESVLAQTHPAMECIVVDDGSTDPTVEIARGFGDRVRVITQRNAGVSAARNRGVREASGDFVAFLDADDVWTETKIERQLRIIGSAPEVGLVYTALQVIDQNGAPMEYRPAPLPARALSNTLLIEGFGVSVAQTALMPVEVFNRVGGFDQALSTSADADFACRVALEGQIVGIDEPLALYRRHGDQMHLDPAATERDSMLVFDKIFRDPRLPPHLASARSRAEANLFTILAASCLLSKRFPAGVRYLLKAMRRRPASPFRLIAQRVGAALPGTAGTPSEGGERDWLADEATHSVWETAYRTSDTAAFFEVAFDWVRTRFSRCDSVLDVGCGTGAHSIRLARRHLDVQAVDVSEVALEAGRAKVRAEGLEDRIEMHREDLLAMSLPDGSVGCVLCWGVLMHVPELEGALHELRRVLRDGGVLVLSEVNARSPEAVAIRCVNRLKDRDRIRSAPVGFEMRRSDPPAAKFTRHCDMRRLAHLVEKHGFRVVTRRPGQLTELYSRTSSRRLRLGLGRLNVWWFRHGTAGPAVGNILVLVAV